MKVQAVASMELCFIDVSVGWPGAMHDARIFRNSALSTALRRNLENTPYHLIADSAYSLGERVIVNLETIGNSKRYKIDMFRLMKCTLTALIL